MKVFCSASLLALLCAVPALATTTTNVTVSSPTAGATVHSPFSLVASGTLCQGNAITAIGYSVDSNAGSAYSGHTLNKSVSASTGSHTVHIKTWGSGAYCVHSVSINVTATTPSSTSGASIPSYAVAIQKIEQNSNWTAVHDDATSGTSSGTTSLMSAPALSGTSRKFHTSYSHYGGERYNSHLGVDTTSKHFVYDARIYIAAGSSNDIANLEMDLNQIMPSGYRVIFGIQCSTWSHTWDYAQSNGYTDSNGTVHHWMHTDKSCDVQKWATNTWHHVQIQYSRDDSGNVTYSAVWLDGVKQSLNITAPSIHPKGWAPNLSTNFQVGGATSTSGSSTIYVDNLTLYKW